MNMLFTTKKDTDYSSLPNDAAKKKTNFRLTLPLLTFNLFQNSLPIQISFLFLN